ncbi:unnamed protein product, partial [Pleuronectes platessa]
TETSHNQQVQHTVYPAIETATEAQTANLQIRGWPASHPHRHPARQAARQVSIMFWAKNESQAAGLDPRPIGVVSTGLAEGESVTTSLFAASLLPLVWETCTNSGSLLELSAAHWDTYGLHDAVDLSRVDPASYPNVSWD